MKQIYYVRRGKNKTTNETYKTVHAADSNYTLCGKELSGMWYVESSNEFWLNKITCQKCKKELKRLKILLTELGEIKPLMKFLDIKK